VSISQILFKRQNIGVLVRSGGTLVTPETKRFLFKSIKRFANQPKKEIAQRFVIFERFSYQILKLDLSQ
jgi:hypothetical protein